MGTIELNTLRKEFGSLVAVNDLDLTITEGSYTMILGPSGCGKSTTLRMIAGLERPTSGDIFIDGNRVTDYPPRERNLSMVFQSLALWDHKTVRENIAFGLKMDDVPKAEREAAVDEVAEILHIEDKLDQSPASLSGGQQQRVALGRSLVREPDVILLDEPLSSLDAKLRLEMRAELSRIQQRIGTTFVHVTHNQEDAMSIADEIILLNDGAPAVRQPPRTVRGAEQRVRRQLHRDAEHEPHGRHRRRRERYYHDRRVRPVRPRRHLRTGGRRPGPTRDAPEQHPARDER
ncbi:ABC transporter ATP-binding protein [Halomicroarcula sp. GCM10025710]